MTVGVVHIEDGSDLGVSPEDEASPSELATVTCDRHETCEARDLAPGQTPQFGMSAHKV